MSAQAQAPLLTTKLHAPETRDRIVRAGLVSRLCDARDAKLALIRAPAGWGKSTLLSQWRMAEAGRRAFAWLSLESADSDPVRFWTYAVEAVRGIAPSVGARSLALLRAPGVDLTAEVLPALAGELGALDEPIVLALDDYHQLMGEPVHASMRLVLEHLPPQVCIALASRTEPPLPVARLRASGGLVEIDADQLRFSIDETRAFLTDVLELDLTDGDLISLHARTEGWPAGLYLAALSLRNGQDPRQFLARFAGDDRHIADYLGEEVLSGLEPAVRDLLLRTSILERMSAALCNAVVGASDSARRLDALARSNLFVVPLDDRREWYRCHHLFRACLNAELRLEAPELIPELHRKASRWLEAAGQFDDAIDHSIKAMDFTAAADLLARYWNAIVQSGGLHAVEMWLMALPEPVITMDARLCLARAWTSFTKGDLDQVLPCVAAAEAAPEPPTLPDGTTSVASGVATLRASYWLRVGDFGQARRYAREALELEHGPWRAIAANCLGTACYWLDDTATARVQLEETVELGRELLPLVAIFAIGLLALMASERGDWDAVSARVREARELIEAGGLDEYWATAAVELTRGLRAEHQDDLERAEASIARSVVLYRRGQAPVETANALLHLARVHARAGLDAVARDEVDEAEALVTACPGPGPRVPRMVALAKRHRRHHLRLPGRAAPGEELSDRELVVLRLMATDLTQREIGRELYVSLNTVKSHTKSIFRKLGVSSREQAVANARELELI